MKRPKYERGYAQRSASLLPGLCHSSIDVMNSSEFRRLWPVGRALFAGRVLVTFLFSLMAWSEAYAAGTGAGVVVPNSVTLEYSQSGLTRTTGATASFFVDELLDVSIVSSDASSIGVLAGETAAVQQYTLTNLGNGSEAFRLTVNDAVAGDDFDSSLNALYLETNGTVGLQVGPGGDDLYVAGTNDPILLSDDFLTVYVTADIPAGLMVDDVALLSLRAIGTTILAGAGTDDPALPAFPAVGTSFPALGDPASTGGGNVAAMVGISYDIATPLYLAQHDFLVNDVGLAITKTAFFVEDPLGGNAVLPGSVVSYRVSVNLVGGGAAQSLVVTDPLPVDVLYVPNSLSVVGLPAGEEADDDLVPAGVDNTGINGETVEVTFGDVTGPLSLTIEYQAIVQ